MAAGGGHGEVLSSYESVLHPSRARSGVFWRLNPLAPILTCSGASVAPGSKTSADPRLLLPRSTRLHLARSFRRCSLTIWLAWIPARAACPQSQDKNQRPPEHPQTTTWAALRKPYLGMPKTPPRIDFQQDPRIGKLSIPLFLRNSHKTRIDPGKPRGIAGVCSRPQAKYTARIGGTPEAAVPPSARRNPRCSCIGPLPFLGRPSRTSPKKHH